MKLFYLIGAIIIFVLILIISFAQIASTCTWSLVSGSPVLILLQMSGLGAVVGGLLVMFWKAPDKSDLDEDVEESEIKGE